MLTIARDKYHATALRLTRDAPSPLSPYDAETLARLHSGSKHLALYRQRQGRASNAALCYFWNGVTRDQQIDHAARQRLIACAKSKASKYQGRFASLLQATQVRVRYIARNDSAYIARHYAPLALDDSTSRVTIK